MATVILIHGTNDTGSKPAKSWWQDGSSFCNTLMVSIKDADNSAVKIERLTWDGKNSENSRFHAAKRLCDLLAPLERQKEKYCLVGHSHGGSIIAHALTLTVARRGTLSHLKSWITVGTPFIRMSRAKLLFNRLDIVSRSFYVLLMFALFVYASLLVRAALKVQFDPNSLLQISKDFCFALGPILLGYVLVRSQQPLKPRLNGERYSRALGRQYTMTWLPFTHPDDEAVNGLKATPSLKLSLFNRGFAVRFFAGLSILLLPLFLIFIFSGKGDMIRYSADSSYKIALEDIDKTNHFNKLVLSGYAIISEIGFKLQDLVYPKHYRLGLITMPHIKPGINEVSPSVDNSPWYYEIVHERYFYLWTPSAAVVLALLTCLLLHVGLNAIGALVSLWSSVALNRSTEAQIRNAIFGHDSLGELVVAADHRPHWVLTSPNPLPSELATEISNVCDAASARLLSQLRRGWNDLIFRSPAGFDPTSLADYLTWKELIHTTYFRIPRFHKLLAYAILESAGWRATSQFESDTDFQLVAKWYLEMKTRTNPS